MSAFASREASKTEKLYRLLFLGKPSKICFYFRYAMSADENIWPLGRRSRECWRKLCSKSLMIIEGGSNMTGTICV
jgi:hypothetical protein